MTDYTFPQRTYVRIDTDPVGWLVVEPGQHLGTIQPSTTFETYEDAVAAGYADDEEWDENTQTWATVDPISEQGAN